MATAVSATDAPVVEQGEQSGLKYLGVVEIAVDKATKYMANIYEFAKDSSGPLKHGVDSVESTVRTVVGPVYQKIEGKPYEILLFVDRKVDDAVGVIEGVVPQTIKDKSSQAYAVARQVPETVKSVVSDLQSNGLVETAKSYYATYQPVAEEWTYAAWKQFLKLPYAPQAVHFAAPPTLFWPGVSGAAGALLEGLDPSEFNATLPGQKRGREDEPAALGDKKWPGWPGDNVFRMIVPTHKVGSIIGRKGEFVKKMCEETRSRIKILDGLPGTPERVVMVSARDEPEAVVSPAMDGLLKVHRRIIDGFENEGDGSVVHPLAGVVSSRLLVAATQAGNLIGRQGTTIKSIQDASGANVRVLSAEEVPSYALQDDRVVEIQGEAGKVLKAMELVVSHLRKFLVDRSILPLFEFNRALQTQNQQAMPQASWGPGSGASLPSTAGSGLGGATTYNAPSLQHENYYQPSDTFESQMHHGLSIYGRDPGVGAISSQIAVPPPVPIITQVTQKMQIPLSYADAIIGTAGANISYMRRTSGATITIQETRGVHGEMTVEIHGTATQVQTAQQLVQNSMAGASVPVPSYTPVEPSYSSYNSQSLYSSATGGTAGLSATAYGSGYSGTYGY